jgi:hypothetical protein
VVGHALLVDKNFIELIALLVIASCAAGRWAGLDYFVEHYVIECWRKYGCKRCCCKSSRKPEEAPQSTEQEAPQTEKEGT